MTIIELKDMFNRQVHPFRPNDWEIEEVLEGLVGLAPTDQRAVMSFVQVVWPISHSLCFAFLEYGPEYVRHFGADEAQLAEWVRQLLGSYEKSGLRGAQTFMAAVMGQKSNNSVFATGTRLEEVRGRLVPFIRGVSGRQLDLAGADHAWTDTGTIYLPEEINHFPDPTDNERFFTFLTCCQWGYIALGTLETTCDSAGSRRIAGSGEERGIESFFARFANPFLAQSIFHYLEFVRVLRLLCTELPGLMRSVQPLLVGMVPSAPEGGAGGLFSSRLLVLLRAPAGVAATEVEAGDTSFDGTAGSCRRVGELYDLFNDEACGDWRKWEPVAGRLHFQQVRERVARRRIEDKQTFIQQLAALIEKVKNADDQSAGRNHVPLSESGDAKQLVVSLTASNKKGSEFALKVNALSVDLPPELAELLSRIQRDLGHVPDGYVQAAAGIAGRGVAVGSGGTEGEEQLRTGAGAILYDEWDFRRQGYRKNWCSLIEKELQPVRSQFVEETLERHRGLLVRLRRQFEVLRTQYRFVRRRRHGDDIDFDALVEAMGDRLAGLAPSERLFVRLLRDTRDIAVLFLIDMSNSTEGWVGKAIKESLVLLGDVLEVVGDRYGIYGFSGMRRSRCELYRIKKLDEPYSDMVRQRICAISPREYTRMAPAVRHLTGLLAAAEAKVRLLMVISDGKPEDYDDYKGEYAIEDTRRSLIEARGKGVIPFCITVDREPHAYLANMFGKDHYIYVDGVDRLPRRMPEIYRLLTS